METIIVIFAIAGIIGCVISLTGDLSRKSSITSLGELIVVLDIGYLIISTIYYFIEFIVTKYF